MRKIFFSRETALAQNIFPYTHCFFSLATNYFSLATKQVQIFKLHLAAS